LVLETQKMQHAQPSRSRAGHGFVLGAGLNGQLPNLDLVNVAVSALGASGQWVGVDRCGAPDAVLLHKERFATTTLVGHDACACKMTSVDRALRWSASRVSEWLDYSEWLDDIGITGEMKRRLRLYISDLVGMLRFMSTLASGPNGVHSAFLGYGIDAVTLLCGEGDHSSSSEEKLHFVKSAEKVVRSLSNTEEKLHASYWLYLMPNHSKFVSIDEYYFAMVLLLLPMFLEAMRLVYCASSFRLAFALVSLLVAEGCGLAVYFSARSMYHLQFGSVLVELLVGGGASHDAAWNGLTAPLLAATIWLGLSAILVLCAARLILALSHDPILQGPSRQANATRQVYTAKDASAKGGGRIAEVTDDPGWCAMKACFLMVLV
jgi:hypothetical protein